MTNGFVYNVGTPSWSSDGAWIAFTTSPAWQPGQAQPARDLWIMRADGSERRNLTQGRYASVESAAVVWTPLPAASRVPTTGGKVASGTAAVGITFSYATGDHSDTTHPLLVEGTITASIPERGRIEVRSAAGRTFPVAWASGALVTFPDGRTAPLPPTAGGAWPAGLSLGTKVRAGGQRWLAATSGFGSALLAVWIDVQP